MADGLDTKIKILQDLYKKPICVAIKFMPLRMAIDHMYETMDFMNLTEYWGHAVNLQIQVLSELLPNCH